MTISRDLVEQADGIAHRTGGSAGNDGEGLRRYGNALLTRQPVLARGQQRLNPLEDSRTAGFVRIKLQGQAVNVYVTHLHHTVEGKSLRARQINDLMAQTDIGLQAETLMSQTQASLELHDYDRAQDLLSQAQSQFERLGGVQAPDDTIAVYASLSQQGLQAEQDLARARALSRRWADYPLARQAALNAGSAYAGLGDSVGYESSAAVMKALDERQLRLVLLVGGLTLLSVAWLGLWLWSRGKSPLDWGH